MNIAQVRQAVENGLHKYGFIATEMVTAPIHGSKGTVGETIIKITMHRPDGVHIVIQPSKEKAQLKYNDTSMFTLQSDEIVYPHPRFEYLIELFVKRVQVLKNSAS